MNRYDDRFSRGRRSEYERDDWRERDRQGREQRSRESFYPGNYGFEEGEYTGRTAGGPDQQPFARNPYSYYPGQSGGQNRNEDDWRNRDRGSHERYGSQRFGQREPYNTRGDYSRSGSFRGRQEDDYGRGAGSRYSESQYSSSSGRGENIGGYGPGGYGFGYEPGQGEWPRRRETRDEYTRGRYGSSVGTRYGEERGFGEGPFADRTDEPGYFGMGYYGDGGAGPGGGFDQRTRRRNYGSLYEDPFSSDRDWRSSDRGGSRGSSERRYRTGPKGYTRSDDRLREDICERLMMADSVDPSEVTVTVKDGQVTLEGTVPNRRMKHTVEDVVDSAPGVQDVDNRLRVERGESQYGSSMSGSSATGGTTTGSTTQRSYPQGTSAPGTTTQGASGASTSQSSSAGTQKRKE